MKIHSVEHQGPEEVEGHNKRERKGCEGLGGDCYGCDGGDPPPP